jgi:hypothetical protein
MNNKIIIAIVVVVAVVGILLALPYLSLNRGTVMGQPANVQIVDNNVAQTGGLIFTLH